MATKMHIVHIVFFVNMLFHLHKRRKRITSADDSVFSGREQDDNQNCSLHYPIGSCFWSLLKSNASSPSDADMKHVKSLLENKGYKSYDTTCLAAFQQSVL